MSYVWPGLTTPDTDKEKVAQYESNSTTVLVSVAFVFKSPEQQAEHRFYRRKSRNKHSKRLCGSADSTFNSCLLTS